MEINGKDASVNSDVLAKACVSRGGSGQNYDVFILSEHSLETLVKRPDFFSAFLIL